MKGKDAEIGLKNMGTIRKESNIIWIIGIIFDN